jgi:GNAT superfamily N-acetyltransferase
VEDKCFRCKMSEMMNYVRMFLEEEAALDWAGILNLKERDVPLQAIGVMDDQYEQMVLASVVWSYEAKGDELTELRLDRVQVDEYWRGKCIGTTLMAMLVAVARYYQVRRITGRISGDRFLWYWYADLGFTIHDRDQLLMEFETQELGRRRKPSLRLRRMGWPATWNSSW